MLQFLQTQKDHLSLWAKRSHLLLDIEQPRGRNDLENPVSFGEWLKSCRKALDLTQEELAQRSGCSVFALRKIESGERRPSKQLAGLLAAALEIPEEDRPTFIRVARGELSLGRIRPAALDSTPASLSPRPAAHHLPRAPTPLLGRESELAAMERIFNAAQCRLLTLTGVGGSARRGWGSSSLRGSAACFRAAFITSRWPRLTRRN